MNKMEKNIEIAKQSLERKLSSIKIDLCNIQESESEPGWYAHYFKTLQSNVMGYNEETEDMKNNFNIEFPDLKKEYEEVLPRIKKYLNPEEVKSE